MANTATLDLKKLDGTEILKNFPTSFNGNMDKIDAVVQKLEENLAYVAVKSGQNWQLPSGKSATIGDFICVNGVLGNATAAITGGSTNIVEGTNWTACSNGGFNLRNNKVVDYTTTSAITVPAYGMKEIGAAADVLGNSGYIVLSAVIWANGYEKLIIGMNRYGGVNYVVARNIEGVAKTIASGTTIHCVVCS